MSYLICCCRPGYWFLIQTSCSARQPTSAYSPGAHCPVLPGGGDWGGGVGTGELGLNTGHPTPAQGQPHWVCNVWQLRERLDQRHIKKKCTGCMLVPSSVTLSPELT